MTDAPDRTPHDVRAATSAGGPTLPNGLGSRVHLGGVLELARYCCPRVSHALSAGAPLAPTTISCIINRDGSGIDVTLASKAWSTSCTPQGLGIVASLETNVNYNRDQGPGTVSPLRQVGLDCGNTAQMTQITHTPGVHTLKCLVHTQVIIWILPGYTVRSA
ncbi:hypothetical protein KIPB_011947 [Kipferlia bialata]|uniref:Uncharacterized protein n=1 Tax=Kipferlia bialata TaxID=797122 RepID=A0A391NZP3_9EUKA|nr:hypothetical protein KIPB_011947 [Kipferlia bialata]|eukprot:g11947.t1